jgi:hypothetical protein
MKTIGLIWGVCFVVEVVLSAVRIMTEIKFSGERPRITVKEAIAAIFFMVTTAPLMLALDFIPANTANDRYKNEEAAALARAQYIDM